VQILHIVKYNTIFVARKRTTFIGKVLARKTDNRCHFWRKSANVNGNIQNRSTAQGDHCWNSQTLPPTLHRAPAPSGTTWVGWYQKKHSPTHTHPDHQTSFINFVHLLRSIASSLFNLHTWQSFSTTSVQVLFGLAHVLEPLTSYSIHFFTQSLSSFRNTCPYHCKLFS